jgi:UDP-N-acetylglucosamine 2-epimerase (non-hydrolysing)
LKIVSVVGVRPNIMKIAPFIRAIQESPSAANIQHILIHTGQHYDPELFENLFLEFELKKPEYCLQIGSGSHAWQVGTMMLELEKFLKSENPDWVVVVDDVNTALATALAAKSLNIPIAHIEAGLRSYDLEMPEEVNRVIVDHLSDLLFVPDRKSIDNLIDEHIPKARISFTGNFMIDQLKYIYQRSKLMDVSEIIKKRAIHPSNKLSGKYVLFTMHRPSNIDNEKQFLNLLQLIKHGLTQLVDTIIWPMHPKAKNKLMSLQLFSDLLNHKKIILLNPLPYTEMIKLMSESGFVLTDSGGLQEESTYLNIPCVTMRNTTERPITLVQNGGTNFLAGNDSDIIFENCKMAIHFEGKVHCPEYWDGNAAKRSLQKLLTFKN